MSHRELISGSMTDVKPRAMHDEATVRASLTIQFDACNACRACVAYCAAFPLMFDLIEGFDGDAAGTRSAGDLTVADQDRIADTCTRCGDCVPACGYGYDVPGRFDQALAMRRATGQLPLWRTLQSRLGLNRRRG